MESQLDRARWPVILAGLGAIAIALARSILGATADLPYMIEGLARPEYGSLTTVNWHALSVTFAILGIALVLVARSTAPAARSIALVAAAIFGCTCGIFLFVNAAQLGSPFANWPWIPLGLETLLCAYAAVSVKAASA